MSDIVVFGVAAVDILVRVEEIPQRGGQVTGEGHGWRVGGSSANVACALASAGHRVQLVGPVGSDILGDELLGVLGHQGVDTEHIFRVPEPSPRGLILLDAGGERTIIGLDNGFGRSGFLPEQSVDLSVDAVWVESYSRFPAHIVADVAPSALLCSSPPVPGATDWPADIVVGSAAQFGSGAPETLWPSLRPVAGPRLGWVVVTHGHQGAAAYSNHRQLQSSAPSVDQIDATGAGDAFAAGLMHTLLAGHSMEAALTLACAWGARAVTEFQSLPPSWAEVTARHLPAGAEFS